MNKKTMVLGFSLVFALVLTACGTTNAATEVVTEAPAAEEEVIITEEPAGESETEEAGEATEEPMVESEPTILVGSTGLGEVLVDPQGMTLYMFVNDGPSESDCYDTCATTWPPLLVEGEPIAGEGLDQTLLGTTERTDGTLQVTYNGLPLYYFIQDAAAGDITGQGVGGAWYVVDPAGEAVTAVGEDLPDY